MKELEIRSLFIALRPHVRRLRRLAKFRGQRGQDLRKLAEHASKKQDVYVVDVWGRSVLERSVRSLEIVLLCRDAVEVALGWGVNLPVADLIDYSVLSEAGANVLARRGAITPRGLERVYLEGSRGTKAELLELALASGVDFDFRPISELRDKGFSDAALRFLLCRGFSWHEVSNPSFYRRVLRDSEFRAEIPAPVLKELRTILDWPRIRFNSPTAVTAFPELNRFLASLLECGITDLQAFTELEREEVGEKYPALGTEKCLTAISAALKKAKLKFRRRSRPRVRSAKARVQAETIVAESGKTRFTRSDVVELLAGLAENGRLSFRSEGN